VSPNYPANQNRNNAIKAGVIGYPVSHSLSPTIHNYYLKKFNIIGSYEKIEIPNNSYEEFSQKIFDLKNQGFAGFNVTLPHKENIFKLCDILSDKARSTKAVNTVLITQDNKIFGENSDIDGFIKNFYNHFPNFDFHNKTALVIGAGGAARAVIYSLITHKISKIIIANRSQEKAFAMLDDFKKLAAQNRVELDFISLGDSHKIIANCNLLINTSPLGMINQPPLDIDISSAKKNLIVYDIVYKPLHTNLLQQAQSLNLPIITGIGMLIEQALIGFEMWFHHKPKFENELEKILINQLKL
jgi:shikimate dehydrogenase